MAVSKIMTTFAPAFEETVPWMSGLVNGLQNRLQQFESARHLSKAKRKLKKKFFSLFLYPRPSFHIPHSTLLENLQLRELSQQHLIHPLNPLAALLDVLTYIIYIIKEVAEGIQ